LLDLLFTFAALALAGGGIAGTWAGMTSTDAVPFRTAFLVWVGLAAVAATTFAQSMDALPLTLIVAALAGIAPFAGGYFVLKRLVHRLRPPE
jgi:threonine/homoserine efflux transporter RhtA